MNSIRCICITWDMDKIIYTCSAEHIGFVFPKRKWWELTRTPREVEFEFVEVFSEEEVGIRVRIEEGEVEQFHVSIPHIYRQEIWQEFINASVKKRRYDTLLIVDPSGSSFPDLLMKTVEDVNYLAVLTALPDAYESVMEELEREYGLMGMIFTQYRDFVKYQRELCAENTVLVWMGEKGSDVDSGFGRTFFRFPKNSLVLDFDAAFPPGKICGGKRMENDYASISIFLDNIVKNRYNSVVNEGLQRGTVEFSVLQQNVSRTDDKNKLGEKRKGIRKWKKRRIS